MTKIIRIVSAQPFPNNSDERRIFRVIGSVDMNGRGINHEIADIDPIIFLDDAYMLSQRGSPFNPHPHRGLVAISYVLTGAIRPSDNVNGTSPVLNQAGGLYYLNSGRGIVHHESADPSFHELHWLQLWFNPGVHNPLKPASAQLLLPNSIPEIEFAFGVHVRIVIGTLASTHSPVQTDWPLQYLHVKMAAHAAATFPLLADQCRGFMYVISDSTITVENSEVSFRQCAEFKATDSASLAIKNPSDESAEFILVCGKPHNRPCFKLSGNGGTLVGDDQASLILAMKDYESDPDNFGRS